MKETFYEEMHRASAEQKAAEPEASQTMTGTSACDALLVCMIVEFW